MEKTNQIKINIQNDILNITNSFDKNIQDDYLCEKCNMVMLQPYTLSCGHIICGYCLEELKQKDNKCFEDKEEITFSTITKRTQTKISNLIIKCPFFHNGCTWKDKIALIAKPVIQSLLIVKTDAEKKYNLTTKKIIMKFIAQTE